MGLSDADFAEWVTAAANAKYVKALCAKRSEENVCFFKRLDAIDDASVREALYAYIDALLSGKTVEAPEEPAEEPAPEEVTEEPAEEPAPEEVTEKPAEEPVPEEVTEEPAEEPVPEEVTEEPAEEPAPEEVTEEPAEEPVPEEVTEEPAEEPAAEEVSAAPIDSPFPGPAEGFALTKAQIGVKAAIASAGTDTYVLTLTEGKDYKAGRLLFACDDPDEAAVVAGIYGAELIRCRHGLAVIKLKVGTVAEAVALAADPDTLYPPVEPDFLTQLDPSVRSKAGTGKTLFSGEVPVSESWDSLLNQGILGNPDPYLRYPNRTNGSNASEDWYQWQHDMINTYEAWSVTTGEPAITVAIIDSGAKLNHEEFWDIEGIDIGLGTEPDGSHGTHVAGIIGARLNNGKGGAGVAPDVALLSIRASENGYFSLSDQHEAVWQAVNSGADIINMSIGGKGYSTVMEDVLEYAYNKGVTVIAAAGNDNDNCESYPAAYSTVIAVASVDRSGYRSEFSNYGKWVTLSAPGNDILSTSTVGSGYEIMGGTSMACPMVTGVAALYMSKYGHTSPAKMRSVLTAACNKCPSSGMGAGIIDAAKLFAADKTPPVIELDGEPVSGSVKAKADSQLFFTTNIEMDKYLDDGVGAFIYTTDGTTPTILDGYVKNGTVCEDRHLTVGDLGAVGTVWTVKVAHVNKIGALSSVTTLKVTVAASTSVSAVHINAPDKIHPGKSAALSVWAEPKYASTDVEWSIVSRDATAAGATIGNDGVLRAAGTDSGFVTVRAVSKADSTRKDEKTIEIVRLDLVTAINLPKKVSLIYSTALSEPCTRQLEPRFKTKSGAITGDIACSWSSSNKKAVTVDASGVITAVGVGTSTVTCRALDGSGKSKSVAVTVKRGVNTLAVSGQSAVAAGTSAVYKASVLPAKAANKAVTWSLVDAPEGVSISSKGKLTVPARVADLGDNISFYVCAEAKDGSGCRDQQKVTVVPRVTSLKLYLSDSERFDVKCTESKGKLASITLYNVDLPDTYEKENKVKLSYTCVGSEYSLVWTSSNPKVADVDENGTVTAHKSGTTTVTLRANDGSGKKASVKINVKVPASTLTIVSSNARLNSYSPYNSTEEEGYYYSCSYIGIGLSVKNKVKAADAYGTPSTSKIKWSIEEIWLESDGERADVTDEIKSKKWITINSSGTLKTGKGLGSVLNKYRYEYVPMYVKIRAVRTEDDVSAEYIYCVVPKVTKLSPILKSVTLLTQPGDGSMSYEYTPFAIDLHDAYGIFTVSSSDPDIAGATLVWDEENGWFDAMIIGNRKPGTAYITLKANDGSGKTAKIKVTVKRG